MLRKAATAAAGAASAGAATTTLWPAAWETLTASPVAQPLLHRATC